MVHPCFSFNPDFYHLVCEICIPEFLLVVWFHSLWTALQPTPKGNIPAWCSKIRVATTASYGSEAATKSLLRGKVLLTIFQICASQVWSISSPSIRSSSLTWSSGCDRAEFCWSTPSYPGSTPTLSSPYPLPLRPLLPSGTLTKLWEASGWYWVQCYLGTWC